MYIKKVLAVFLDLEKAFDSIYHATLLKKMDNAGIRGNAFKWFTSYLYRKYQCVLIMSKKDFIRTGVPQGSVLGPILFLIFINGFCDLDVGGTIVSDDTTADDTTVVFVGGKPQRDLVNKAEGPGKDVYRKTTLS